MKHFRNTWISLIALLMCLPVWAQSVSIPSLIQATDPGVMHVYWHDTWDAESKNLAHQENTQKFFEFLAFVFADQPCEETSISPLAQYYCNIQGIHFAKLHPDGMDLDDNAKLVRRAKWFTAVLMSMYAFGLALDHGISEKIAFFMPERFSGWDPRIRAEHFLSPLDKATLNHADSLIPKLESYFHGRFDNLSYGLYNYFGMLFEHAGITNIERHVVNKEIFKVHFRKGFLANEKNIMLPLFMSAEELKHLVVDMTVINVERFAKTYMHQILHYGTQFTTAAFEHAPENPLPASEKSPSISLTQNLMGKEKEGMFIKSFEIEEAVILEESMDGSFDNWTKSKTNLSENRLHYENARATKIQGLRLRRLMYWCAAIVGLAGFVWVVSAEDDDTTGISLPENLEEEDPSAWFEWADEHPKVVAWFARHVDDVKRAVIAHHKMN